MKVLFLSNNSNANELYDWISKRCIAEKYSGKLSVEYLKEIKPDVVISYNYSHIIPQNCIDFLDENIINLHISYLPWNRGASPNVWSFIDNTPKGVSVHMISAGIDEGDILFQREMQFNISEESFQTTYTKLNKELIKLFKENWENFATGDFKKYRRKQTGKGSYHTMEELKRLKEEIPFEWTDNIEEFLECFTTKNS